MRNHDNQQQNKQYKVYIPSTHQFVPVTKEFYYEYYRPIWCTQKQAQKLGQCMCPKSKLWSCGPMSILWTQKVDLPPPHLE